MPISEAVKRHSEREHRKYAPERRFADHLLRCIELGHRAAVRLGNEAEGWGPWVDTTHMFEMRLDAIEVHADWLPHPHPAPFVPRQRQPSRFED